MARLIAPKMGEALGQSVVIENKPGASGQIGASAVAKAAPDGYTLMLDASSFSANPALYPKLPYDPIKDFAPITLVAHVPNVLVMTPERAQQRHGRDARRREERDPAERREEECGGGSEPAPPSRGGAGSAGSSAAAANAQLALPSGTCSSSRLAFSSLMSSITAGPERADHRLMAAEKWPIFNMSDSEPHGAFASSGGSGVPVRMML